MAQAIRQEMDRTIRDPLLFRRDSRGLEETQIKEIEDKLADSDDLLISLNYRSEEIPDSALDAYSWEVGEPNDLMATRSKRRSKKEFLEEYWLENNVLSKTEKSLGKNGCPKCGERINEIQKFCRACGHHLKSARNCAECGHIL